MLFCLDMSYANFRCTIIVIIVEVRRVTVVKMLCSNMIVVSLTHDSISVRKSHAVGRNHIKYMIDYYESKLSCVFIIISPGFLSKNPNNYFTICNITRKTNLKSALFKTFRAVRPYAQKLFFLKGNQNKSLRFSSHRSTS